MATRRDRTGTWRYRRVVKLPDGSKVRISGTPAINTKLAAEEAERAHILRALSPTAARKEVPTFDAFADEFMATYAKANNKPSEVAAKECILKHHLRPALGSLRLNAITTREIETIKAKLLGAGRTAKRVNNVLAVLSKILRYGHEVGALEAVPRIKLLKLPPSKFDFFTFEEYARLLDSARAEPEWATAILVAAEAGLRMGEIVALEWDAVDLPARTLTVRAADWHGIVGPPKGGRARTIPLSAKLSAALRRHRHLRGPRVFCGDSGEPLTRSAAKHGLWRACRRAGLRKVGWHVLRHTFCSHLAMRGAAPKAIQELAGHASIKETMRYMHLAPTALREAIDLLDGNGVATTWQRLQAPMEFPST